MEITLSKKAVKALEGLDVSTKARIMSGIAGIPKGDIKPMQGFSDGRKRLRIGKYRVVFIQTAETIHALDIGSRGDIYK